MRSILILNPKGGSGKSTLATNIAAYFALQQNSVALADCDPQGSSKDLALTKQKDILQHRPKRVFAFAVVSAAN